MKIYSLRIRKTQDLKIWEKLKKLAKKNELSVNQQILMLIRDRVKNG